MKQKHYLFWSKLKTTLPAVVGVAALSAAVNSWRHLQNRPLPVDQERFDLRGLNAPVEIIRDRWGVPHIYAQNEQDLFFAQGFVHAQDRLFQMDTFRRVGAGRVSELVGPSGLAADRFARYFGWKKVAELQISNADEQAEALMASYGAGVNAYMGLDKLPLEFLLLAYKPEPWSSFDTAVWAAVLNWGLSVNWETELLRALILEYLGPEKAVDLTFLYGDDYKTIIPDTRVGQRLASALLESYQQAILNMPLSKIPSGKGVGSNSWVVSGQHTATGRPIVANDPHLPPLFPPFWFENHLVGGEYNVTGFSIPGIPGVLIGHNQSVAWGVSNAFPDAQDIYIERFHDRDRSLYEVNGHWQKAKLIVEEIKVRGRKTVKETIRYTRHGPVFSDLMKDQEGDFSLQWSSFSPSNQMRAILDMNRAANWPEFRQSVQPWGFASQNIVCADTEGNIGYVMPGLIPQRRKGAGLQPVPGWIDDFEWDGWIPFAELPVYANPEEGMIVTANNRMHGNSYPHLLTGEWLPDYRAQRIWQLLEANIPLTVEINGTIQSDTVSLLMIRFIKPALAIMLENQLDNTETADILRRLEIWNGDMRPELIEPSISYAWLVNFTHAVIEQAVGHSLAEKLFKRNPPESFPLNPFQEIAPQLVINWLERGSPSWVGDIQPLLSPALQKSLAILRQKLGPDPAYWQWGKLHYVELKHPLAAIPILGRMWKPIKLPAGGDAYTVNQSEVGLLFPPQPVGVIASCRLIMDVGEWDNSLAVLPGGQSGHPASSHFQDGLVDWRTGRYHPLLYSRDKIEQEKETVTKLEPLKVM